MKYNHFVGKCQHLKYSLHELGCIDGLLNAVIHTSIRIHRLVVVLDLSPYFLDTVFTAELEASQAGGQPIHALAGAELDAAQREYERQQIAQYESALTEIESALGVNA